MIRKPLDENANSSICCNFDPVSNANGLSEVQDEKHDLHKISTLGGIIMPCTPLDEKVYSSIRCNFDPPSNVSDVSENRFEKHDLHKTLIDDGIQH
jgi:hypothetical protein